MSGLMVDADRCIGCGRCVKACGSGGIVVEGPRGARRARATESCIACAACVDACPVGALAFERPSAADSAGCADARDYWVFVQTDEHGSPLGVSLELMGRACSLADVRGCRVVALLPEGLAGDRGVPACLIAAGADEVVRCRDERFSACDAAVHAEWVCELARRRKPEAILYGATVFGRELAPRVAVRLQTGLTADCTSLDIDRKTGLLLQTRPAFGGNLMATIACPSHRPQMATVRPGIFPMPRYDEARAGEVVDVRLDAAVRPRVVLRGVERAREADALVDAEVLVVAGRGIGSKKNLALAGELARALGGKLGGTRPLVEAGWLEPWQQVGQTGVAVAPRVLLSLGVSGAIQHVSGISAAQSIIAVNDDAHAPIFDVARYRVVADCVAFASELLERLDSQRGDRG